MVKAEIPDYAVFEDYRPTVGFAVLVRWVLLAAWLFVLNYRIEYDQTWAALIVMAGGLAALNAYMSWRIVTRRPISLHYAFALSVADLTVITASLFLVGGLQNPYYVFYYPALLGLSLMFPGRASLALASTVIALYISMAFIVSPTLIWEREQEKWLVTRIFTMVGIVAAGMLITGWERGRREEAVAAERQRAHENLELQRRAQKAEREVQEERIRISQDTHDGAAQSAYVLSLGLETCLQLAKGNGAKLRDRLKALHAQSTQVLWELRYSINLGPLFEGKGLAQILDDHVENFKAITSIPTTFAQTGKERELPAVTKQRLFSVAHNALTNVYKYAQASKVSVELAYSDGDLNLSISDDGVGLDIAGLDSSSGHGVRNMRRVAEELGGSLDMSSAPGKGTTVMVTVPLQEGAVMAQ